MKSKLFVLFQFIVNLKKDFLQIIIHGLDQLQQLEYNLYKMKVKSIKGRTAEDIKFSVTESMADGFKPSLAIVFIGAEGELQAVRSFLSGMEIQIFGASTGTNFTDGEIISQGIVILLFDINLAYFRVEIRGPEWGSTKDKAVLIAGEALAAFRKPAFMILSGGVTADGDEIVDGLESVCGKGATIFGGLAADALKMERTYVFTNDIMTDFGLAALIFDEEKISLNGMAVGGWRPVGIDHIVTKSSGNTVYSIDDEPALEFIRRYSGFDVADLAGQFEFLATNFQLELSRKDKHPVMRTPMRANKENGSITFAGALPEGSIVRLSLLPSFEVIDSSLREFENYKRQEPDVDALVLFSCAGREMSLGPYANEEVERIKEMWNVPLAGFFCYGEIGRVRAGHSEFQNMTFSLSTLKEK